MIKLFVNNCSSNISQYMGFHVIFMIYVNDVNDVTEGFCLPFRIFETPPISSMCLSPSKKAAFRINKIAVVSKNTTSLTTQAFI